MQNPALFIIGPTASGKTSLATDLAHKFNGELINCDSRQVYKYMDIGTNKGELRPGNLTLRTEKTSLSTVLIDGIESWLFDLIVPDAEFSLAAYYHYAKIVCADIQNREKLPIFVGGTGLYVDAIIRDYNLTEVPPDATARQALENLSVQELAELITSYSNNAYAELNESDKKNKYRLIRLIELLKAGKKHNREKFINDDFLLIYPKFEKELLYESINARAEAMFAEGLVKEVEALIKMGYGNARPLMSMGYKEVLLHLDGKITLEEAIESTQQKHRNYAKRQITWFEGVNRGYKLNKYNFKKDKNKIYELVKEFLNKNAR